MSLTLDTPSAPSRPSSITGAASAGYALVAYLAFFASFGLYVARVWGLLPVLGPGLPAALAIVANVALVAGFGVQHTIMARPAFKRWWTQRIPAVLERSTFVLAASAMLTLLAAAWQPVGGSLWEAEGALRWSLYAVSSMGWLLVVVSSFAIDHFHLFGLKQVWTWLHGTEPEPAAFAAPGPYKAVRHPMMLGVVIGMWASPTMDGTTAVLAALLTLYVVIGIRFEERDLRAELGDIYAKYQGTTPALVPFRTRSRS